MADHQDWYAWHDGYGTQGSVLARRLVVVQEQIREALDHAPPGPLRVVSLCAGQGQDLLGVLPDHPRRGKVSARLVELDPRNTAVTEAAAAAAGLDRVEVVVGDAALTDHYAGLVPADLVPRICDWFEETGFEQLALSGKGEGFGVGAHRFAGAPRPLATGARMFTFIGRPGLARS